VKLEEKRNLLSKEFQVAVVIWEITKENSKIAWFSVIGKKLKAFMSRTTLSRVLKYLESWGMIKVQYGPTPTGHAGRLYSVSNEDSETIQMLYEKYWKE